MEGLTGRIVARSAGVFSRVLAAGTIPLAAALSLLAAPASAAQPMPSPATTPAQDPEAIARTADSLGSASDWSGIVVLLLAAVTLAVLWGFDVIRPGSFRRRPKRDVTNLPTMVWFAGAFLIFGSMLLGMLMAHGTLSFLERLSERANIFVTASGYAAGIATAFILMRMTTGGHARDGMNLRPKDAVLGAAWFIPTVLVTFGVSVLSVMVVTRIWGEPDAIAHSGLSQIVENRDDPWVWVQMAAAVLAAPFVEEVMYRGFIQSGLMRLLGGRVWPAILITSAVFAVMHVGAADLYALPTLGVLGVCMGVAFERTRGLAAPIVIHIGFNALNIVLAFAGS